jgi:uncharacterized iron-regulated membrane protein
MLKVIHRWLGLFIGLVLVVVSLSGSWLIYHREWRQPEFVLNPEQQTLPLELLYTSALTVLDKSAGVVIRFPQNPELPYQIWSMGSAHERVFINQYSGEVLAKLAPDYWPYGWVFELHTEFLAGKTGETILGIFGFGALIISIIGIFLWLPKPGQKFNRNLKLRLNKNRYVRHYDLHRHIGILTVPIFTVIFVTGICLVFNKEFSQLVNWITRSKVIEAAKSVPNDRLKRANLDSIVESAEKAMPGGRLGIMIIPAENKPIVVRKQMTQDPHPNGLNFIHLDAITGKPLQLIPVSEADFARKLFNWIYPLHTGEVFKEWYYWVLFVIGFVPAILLFTACTTFAIRKLHARSTKTVV